MSYCSRAVHGRVESEFKPARYLRDSLMVVLGGGSIELMPKWLDQDWVQERLTLAAVFWIKIYR